MSIFTLSILFNRERRIEPVKFGSTSPESPTTWDPSHQTLSAESEARLETTEPVIYTAEDMESAFVRGHQEGKDECNATVEAMRTALSTALDQIAKVTQRLTEAYQQEAVELAIAIAETVIGQSLKSEPDALTHVVQQALEQMPQVEYAVIQCHPGDLEAIDAMRPAGFSQHGKPLTLQIEANPSIEPGGVIITFEEGAIDAQPSVAISLIREAIETSLAGPRLEADVSMDAEDAFTESTALEAEPSEEGDEE